MSTCSVQDKKETNNITIVKIEDLSHMHALSVQICILHASYYIIFITITMCYTCQLSKTGPIFKDLFKDLTLTLCVVHNNKQIRDKFLPSLSMDLHTVYGHSYLIVTCMHGPRINKTCMASLVFILKGQYEYDA